MPSAHLLPAAPAEHLPAQGQGTPLSDAFWRAVEAATTRGECLFCMAAGIELEPAR